MKLDSIDHRRAGPGWIRLAAVMLILMAGHAALAEETDWRDRTTIGTAERTELNIPTSPAFTLLGVNPAMVTRPGFARDLNLDMIVREDQLVSDMAIDLQPIWLLLYGDVTANEMAKQGWFMDVVSSLSLSLATSQTDTTKSLAYGVRLTLFRQTDPMKDPAYLAGIAEAIAFSKQEKEFELDYGTAVADTALLHEQIRNSDDPAVIAEARKALKATEAKLKIYEKQAEQLDASTRKRLADFEKTYRNLHWNDAAVDAGFGQVALYDDTELSELEFAENGLGFWLNGSVGIGRNAQLTALWKYLEFDHGIERFAGANLRYGDANAVGFVEAIWEGSDTRHIGLGAEFKLNGSLAVEAGLRTTVDDDFKLDDLTPEVKVHWSALKKLL